MWLITEAPLKDILPRTSVLYLPLYQKQVEMIMTGSGLKVPWNIYRSGLSVLTLTPP